MQKIMLLNQPESAEPMAILECTLAGHKSWINSIAVSPDGTWAISGSGHPSDSNFEIRIWDLKTSQCRSVIKNHTGLVTSLVIMSDAEMFISASFDKTVRVWDAVSGQEVGIARKK